MSPTTRAAIRYSLGVFAAVRVGLFVLGLVGVAIVPPIDPVSVPGWPANPLPDPGLHHFFTAWERFDALWFLRIAEGGYAAGDGSAAFFPLYPLLIRAVSWAIGGHPFAAALLVSNVAFAAALCLVYVFTAEERSVPTARTTVLLLATFPTSLFFYAPYSEPLFLLLSVLALREARRRRWALAAGAGALAALTRNVGVIVAAALAVEAIHQRVEDGRNPLPGLAAAVASGLGTVSYLAYWQIEAGEPLAPIHQQANWQRTFQWPWETLVEGTRTAFGYAGQAYGGYWLVDLLLVVPVLAAGVYVILRFRPGYAVYVWGGLLIPLSLVFEPRPLMSMPRFVLPLFPAFWAIAEVTRRWRVPRAAVVGVGAAGLGCLTVLFVNWYYIF